MLPFGTAAAYDASPPAEIARADALDALDLALGRDFDGPAPPCRPTRTPPGPDKVAVLAPRAGLGLSLFDAADAPLGAGRDDGPPRPPRPPARGRRPSELARTKSYRDRDAARKRAERGARRESA